jgi:hypothetical protein
MRPRALLQKIEKPQRMVLQALALRHILWAGRFLQPSLNPGKRRSAAGTVAPLRGVPVRKLLRAQYFGWAAARRFGRPLG